MADFYGFLRGDRGEVFCIGSISALWVADRLSG
jgi:hypothetical protein